MTSGSRCENISCMLWMISSRLWDSNWPLLDCMDPKLLYDESARVTKDPFAPCARLSEPLPYSAAACIGAREGLSPFFFFFGILLCPFYKTPKTNPLFTSFSRGRKVKENQTNNSQRRSKNTAAPPVDGNRMTPKLHGRIWEILPSKHRVLGVFRRLILNKSWWGFQINKICKICMYKTIQLCKGIRIRKVQDMSFETSNKYHKFIQKYFYVP